MNEAIRAILAGAIDYAGLFPPASLPMSRAVEHYGAYRSGAEAWALGRLVVPSTRLDECRTAAAALLVAGDPWHISALVGDPAALAGLASFNDAHGERLVVDAAEGKAATPRDIEALAIARPAGIELFVELAVDDALEANIAQLRATGLAAKIRMGGVVASAFPPVDDVVRFLRTCFVAGVTFKATAGLHHPLRGDYRLTYADDAPLGTMYGYLNVFGAVIAMRAGADDAAMRRVLLATGDAPTGDPLAVGLHQVADARSMLPSFGSCSFREPLDDLAALHLA